MHEQKDVAEQHDFVHNIWMNKGWDQRRGQPPILVYAYPGSGKTSFHKRYFGSVIDTDEIVRGVMMDDWAVWHHVKCNALNDEVLKLALMVARRVRNSHRTIVLTNLSCAIAAADIVVIRQGYPDSLRRVVSKETNDEWQRGSLRVAETHGKHVYDTYVSEALEKEKIVVRSSTAGYYIPNLTSEEIRYWADTATFPIIHPDMRIKPDGGQHAE